MRIDDAKRTPKGDELTNMEEQPSTVSARRVEHLTRSRPENYADGANSRSQQPGSGTLPRSKRGDLIRTGSGDFVIPSDKHNLDDFESGHTTEDDSKSSSSCSDEKKRLLASRPLRLRRPSSYGSGLDALAAAGRSFADGTASSTPPAYSSTLKTGLRATVGSSLAEHPPVVTDRVLAIQALSTLSPKDRGLKGAELCLDDIGETKILKRSDLSSSQSRTRKPEDPKRSLDSGDVREKNNAGGGKKEGNKGRQRATTVTTVPAKTQISNLSIFKTSPGEIPDTCITIYTDEEHGGSGDEENSPHGHQRNSSIMKSIKAYTNTAAKPGETGSEVSYTTRSSAASRTFAISKRRLTPTPESSSVATFDTSPATSNVKKRMKRKLKLQRKYPWFPQRMLSFRNVTAVANAIIMVIAIDIIMLVSYFSGYQETNKSRMNRCRYFAKTVGRSLEAALYRLQQQQTIIAAYFVIDNANFDNVSHLLRHLYVDMSERYAIQPEGMYAVSEQGYYDGLSRFRYMNGTVNENLFMARYIRRDVLPYRLTYLVPNKCNILFQNCIDITGIPFRRAFYDVKSQPYYLKAINSSSNAWTHVYPVGEQTLGMTNTATVFKGEKSPSLAIGCVDISLQGISAYLDGVARNLTSGRLDSPACGPITIFILERTSGYLIASSKLETPLFTSSLNRYTRIRAIDSIDTDVNTAALSLFGTGEIRRMHENETIVTIVRDTILVAVPYTQTESDIDWVIGMAVPVNVFATSVTSNYLLNMVLVAMFVLFTSVLFSVCLTRALGKRLKRTAQLLMHIADLNFDENVGICADSSSMLAYDETYKSNRWSSRLAGILDAYELKEIGYIRAAMASMRTGLKSFSKYVPLDVVTLLVKMKREAVLGVDETELTIFFSDIANFTTIAEQMTPSDLVVIMSEYLHEMSSIILESQGIVDKYIGDAIMAFWNAPLFVEDHAVVGCGAALKYQQRLRELRQAWIDRDFPEIYARIGMSTGKALVGNFGSPDRLSYTCLGDNVNLASRLEGLNKYYGTEIMISGSVYEQVQEHFICRTLDSVAVKGKSVPTRVHELIGFRALASDTLLQKVAIYEQAYNLYCEANFLEAKGRFEKFLRLQPDDLPAEKHVKECEKMLENPPGTFWRPVVVLEDK